MIAPVPPDETKRLDVLRQYCVLDTGPEREFDDLTRLASRICETPIALVSLVDPCRQWFKSRVGLEATETPRDIAFCAYAILSDEPLVVPDATLDERFKDNPLVTGEPRVRFYAGVPLTAPEGYNLGTLCVIDQRPRHLSGEQLEALGVLARQVVAQLVLRRQVHALEKEVRERKQAEAALRVSQERFRMFMNNSPAIALVKDEAGRHVYVNEPACRRFGIPEEKWLGSTDYDLWPAPVARRMAETDAAVLAGDRMLTQFELMPSQDGESCYWQVFKFPFEDEGGRRFLAVMAVDRTQEKKAFDALRNSEDQLSGILDMMDELVHRIGPDGRILYTNRAWRKKLGYGEEEVRGLSVHNIIHPDEKHVLEANLARILAGERVLIDSRLVTRDGRTVVVCGTSESRFDEGVPVYVQTVLRDITEERAHENRLFLYQLGLEEANAKLKELACTDGLTGVKNRAAFNARLTEEFDRAVRHGHPLSLMILDVDYFKRFNDSFGHPVGDQVLRQVARCLEATARTSDFVARYGGEEFALILPDTDLAGAVVMAERCRRAIAAAPWERRAITVSVGVTTLAPAAVDPFALVQEADEALYHSKQAGRNRVTHAANPRALLPPLRPALDAP